MKTIKLFVATVLLAFAGNAQYDTWQTYGTPVVSTQAASIPVLKVENSEPYVAYKDVSIGGKINVKKHDGTDWVYVGDGTGASSVASNEMDFALNDQGIPYIIYPNFFSSSRMMVRYFDGTSWQDLGGFLSTSTSTLPNIEIHNQSVFAAFYNSNPNQTTGISVKTFNPVNSTWVDVGAQLFGTNVSHLDLAIDANGVPYLAAVQNNSQLLVMKLDGNIWPTVGFGYVTSNVDGSFTSGVKLKFDNNNNPYVCFADTSKNSALTVLSFDGSSWNDLNSTELSDENVKRFDLAIDDNGQAYVSFSYDYGNIPDNRTASVKMYNGTDWSWVGSSFFTSSSTFYSPYQSLGFIGSSNTPMMAYDGYIQANNISVMKMTPCSETVSSISPTGCNSYTSPSGNYTWTSSGAYSDTIRNAQGCDSVISVSLTVQTIDTTVNQIFENLSSNYSDSNATYQWIDCSDNSPIPGATSQQYEATTFGEYAVIVGNGTCTDTSACYEVTGFNHLEELLSGLVKVYPNPTENIVNIDVSKWLDVDAMKIVNLQGQTMKGFNGLVNQVDISELSPGTYFLVISSEGKSIHKKITKQ